MVQLTQNDINRFAYNVSSGGLDVDSSAGASASFSEGFEGTLTDVLLDSAGNVLHDENVTMTGSEANAKYNLRDDMAFKDDEEVSADKAKMIGERHLQKTINEAEMSAASSTTAGTVTNFLAGLAGGMADPVGIALGSAVGAAAVGKFIPKVANPSLLKTFGREFTENVVGAALVDAPSLLINRSMHKDKFDRNEYLTMVLGAGLLGGAIGTGVTKIKAMRASLGDSADEVIEQAQNTKQYADSKGTDIDPDISREIHQREVHTVRSHQAEYEYTPAKEFTDVKDKEFYMSVKEDGNIHQVNDLGAGTIFLTDNPNIAENAVVKSDGSTTGNISVYKIDQSKVAGDSDIATVKQNIVEKYPELEGKLDKIDDPAELSDAISKGLGLDDGESVFHTALKDSGFDGYITAGRDSLGNKTHNGIAMIESGSFGKDYGESKIGATKVRDYQGVKPDSDDPVIQEMHQRLTEDMENIVTQGTTDNNPAPKGEESGFDMEEQAIVESKLSDIEEALSLEDDAISMQFKEELAIINKPETIDKVVEGIKVCYKE